MSTITQLNSGFYSRLKYFPETWASTTAYAVGDIVKSSVYNNHAYLCTAAGTTGSTEPTWVSSGTNTDGSVTWTCYDTKTYQVLAPQSASFPYVIFGLLDELPINEFGSFDCINDCNYWVNVFSNKSPADVNELADEVLTIMDNSSVQVSGGTVLKIQHTYIGNIIFDETAQSYQVPLRFKLWVD